MKKCKGQEKLLEEKLEALQQEGKRKEKLVRTRLREGSGRGVSPEPGVSPAGRLWVRSGDPVG